MCCRTIADNDVVDRVKPFVNVLSFTAVEVLIEILDDFQFTQFECFFPVASTVEHLFLMRYKRKLHNLWPASSQHEMDWALRGSGNELVYFRRTFWHHKMQSLKYKKNGYGTEAALVQKICNRIPEHVNGLHFNCSALSASISDLARLVNVEYLSIEYGDQRDLATLLEFAKEFQLLNEVRFKRYDIDDTVLQWLKQFLFARAAMKRPVAVKFFGVVTHIVRVSFEDWLLTLGDAMNGLSGLKFETSSIHLEKGHWLTEFSKVNDIKVLELYDFQNVQNCLFDIVQHAPTENHDDKMSKLKLVRTPILLDTFLALHHWRYARLEQFIMININLGDHGASLIAKHATFWPSLKEFTVEKCNIAPKGFLALLSSMMKGIGCQNLTLFNISKNSFNDAVFKHIAHLINFGYMTKLKFLLMQHGSFQDPLPMQFVAAIAVPSFITFDLSGLKLDWDCMCEMFSTFFLKPNSRLLELRLGNYFFASEELQRARAYYNSMGPEMPHPTKFEMHHLRSFGKF